MAARELVISHGELACRPARPTKFSPRYWPSPEPASLQRLDRTLTIVLRRWNGTIVYVRRAPLCPIYCTLDSRELLFCLNLSVEELQSRVSSSEF